LTPPHHTLWGPQALALKPHTSPFRFTHDVYDTTIYENSSPKTYVESGVKMGIWTMEPTGNENIKYQIVSQDSASIFKAEEHSVGDFCFLRVRIRNSNMPSLNREVKDQYLLTVQASDGTNRHEAWTKVVVHVLDMNDLRPLFSPVSYTASVGEDTPLRSSVAKVTATDADIGSNGEFYYAFKHRTDTFAIHPTSGVVTLAGSLNLTTARQHKLEILAVDRMMKLHGGRGVGSTSKLTVNVEQGRQELPEILTVHSVPPGESPSSTLALIVTKEGVDQVDIIDGDPADYFKVVQTYPGSKEFKLISLKDTNWASNDLGYNLSLQARVKSNPTANSPVKVIHVPANQPKTLTFAQDLYEVRLSEIAPPNSPVVLVVARPKHPNVRYHLESGHDGGRFRINPQTGLITTAGELNLLEQSRFELKVKTDAQFGRISARVVIDLVDANNHAPEFPVSLYQGNVDENVPIGTSILTVKAIDKDQGDNGHVSYSIANAGSIPFNIEPFTGTIITSKELDYELMQRVYHLQVWASDWGSPFAYDSEVPVTIYLENLNDNNPMFENNKCRGNISRSLGVGDSITTVSAIDADELKEVKYELLSGNEMDFFRLDPTSGVLELKQPFPYSPVDGTTSFNLKLTARDGENYASPIYINLTVIDSPKMVSMYCEDTGAIKSLAESLLLSVKPHSQPQEEDLFSYAHIINAHTPQFDADFPTSISVRENVPVNSTVLYINVTDPDSGFNGKLIYVISSGNEDSSFVAEMETGRLKVALPLDYETTRLYTLNVTVYDLGKPQKSSWRPLEVHVLDSNDNKPVFAQDGYWATVREDAVLGTSVAQPKAEDQDEGGNGRVKYSLLTDTDTFAIDEISGTVLVTGKLDRELCPVHFLKVEAKDQSAQDDQLSSVVDLIVALEDVNDNPPRFVPSHYTAKVPEDVPVGTVIVWLEAYDPDLGLGGQVNYSLMDNSDSTFRVDKVTGAVRVNKQLDFERRDLYNLTARAVDGGKPQSLSSKCYVAIEVLDVNENLHPPRFPSFVIQGSVSEDAPVGTSVVTLTAQDGDPGKDGEIRYLIKGGSGLGVFSINEKTGVMQTTMILDRETVPHYWLTVHATDSGLFPTVASTEVFISITDVNDNPPQTTEPVYYTSITENSPKGQSVLRIEAHDPDSSSEGHLSFSISSESPRGFFAIDPKTGMFTLLFVLMDLDREKRDEHILEVTVKDNGDPPRQSRTKVMVGVVDENDNAPRFPEVLYNVRLPERNSAAQPEAIYRVIASDRDVGPNGDITYSIEDPPEEGKFYINPKSAMVSSTRAFTAGDYDILTIRASDNGNPQKSTTVRLHIEWIETPAPSTEPLLFDEPHFTFAVMETDPVNHMVGVTSTELTKSQLWFDIIGGNNNEEFEIEKNTGSITIAKPLNASLMSNYNLTVKVTDGTNAVTTQAYIKVIDINDHRPQFSAREYEVRIPEDIAPPAEILRVKAHDKDGRNKLIYTIQSSVDDASLKLFHLDPTSGALLTTDWLDYESIRLHTLTAMVRDQEIPVKRNFVRINIIVEDSNDYPPKFIQHSYKASVAESTDIGSEVLQVIATDSDTGVNAEIVYSIQSGNSGNMFAIDPVSGKITVTKEMDQAVKGTYNLTVKAEDRGFPQLSTVTSAYIVVLVSDNSPPRFLMSEYYAEISEAISTGSSVVTVTATSQSAVTYEIKDGNTDQAFRINPYSGLVSVHKALDFETIAAYRLTVQGANMAGLSSSLTVFIDVIDENDNAPVFVQSRYVGRINENSPVNSVVLSNGHTPLVIEAQDRDRDANALLVYQIVEPEAQKYFTIDPSMGTLSTASPIDRETHPVFHLTVQVRDSGRPRRYATEVANVTVMVTDVNDCPPRFEKDVYETTLLVPAHDGTRVLTVKAEDADSPGFSNVTYSILEGNGKDAFTVGAASGLISVNDASRLENHHELTVRATDGMYKSSAVVKINTVELPETGLRFALGSQSLSVSEDSRSMETLGVVKASGNQLNEPLFYSVLNPDAKFKVVRTSGAFQTTGVPCDREEVAEFEFVVEARDARSPPRVARTLVKVSVEDVNDNPPVFVNLPYVTTVPEDAEPGDVLFQVSAVDKDAGDNAVIHYSLANSYRHFWMDPYLGDISLSEHLGPDALDKYVLTVTAQDRGSPPLFVQTEVVITVRDKSTPVFEKMYYRVRVAENISPYTPILHVHAISPSGFRVIYNIVTENALRLFAIEFKAGVLSVVDALDYESQTQHVVTVRATDSMTGSSAEAVVEIEVQDVNDNPPIFTARAYGAVLSEASIVGTSVAQVKATDADSGRNKAISYQFVANEYSRLEYFYIDSNSGLVTTARALDHEKIQHYALVVRAVDNGIPPLSSDVLLNVNVSDFNDNPPMFQQDQYATTISEVATCGHFVIRVQASDADSMDINNLEYVILEGNEQRHFTIGTKSGIISVSNSCKKILRSNYHLNVSVSDRVYRRSIPVRINTSQTNKYAPVFDQSVYEVELPENAEVGTHVIELLAVDPDAGPYGSIDYTIINKLAREKFSIDGKGRILTSQKLDRENSTERVIAIKVMAKDRGGKVDFCTVNIILTDKNDNAPQFQAAEYNIHIPANTFKGAPVIQIVAIDADEGINADVVYSVASSEANAEEILDINPVTGFITIKESLVGLENSSFTYHVKAQDGGFPQRDSCVPVRVKVIPPELSIPRFSEPLYSFSASEDLPTGSEIGVIKAEADQPVIYSLVRGNTAESNKGGVFALDQKTGTLKIERSIDHEKTKWYQIDVIATCSYKEVEVASSVSINIQVKDVNDNHPVFEANPYKAFIPENLPAGTTVIQVTANDQDTGTNGHVSYRLSNEFDHVTDIFAIDGERGWLTTLRELDCEAKAFYKVAVVAVDHGGRVQLSSTAVVEVEVSDENDNPPQFTSGVYRGTVSEDSEPGETVAFLTMTDADMTDPNRYVTCYITGGDPLGQFSIDQVPNQWRVYVSEALDREEKEKYILNITATDGKFLAESVVEVFILDVNDNSPQCQQLTYTEAISEGAPSGQFIVKVSAKDSDAGINAQISYTLLGPATGEFRLDPQTGELTTFAPLDRESQAVYNLVAKASDGSGQYCEMDIVLVLEDINDNPPKFSAPQYSVSIFDNTTIKTPVAVVHARDPDVGLNSELTYSLADSANGFFSIDEHSGVVYLAKALHDERQANFDLLVRATDQGSPRRLSSLVHLFVSVVDIDKFVPVFRKREYVATVPESVSSGYQILSVSALTKDRTDTAQILYSISNGNEHNKFYIDPKTGTVYLNGTLDFETCREYYLSVEGTREGKPSFSDSTTVIINVTDVNDNPPRFSHRLYNVEISEDATLGASVITLMADDRDGPQNNLIHYSLVKGDTRQQFSLNSRTGEISVSQRLDREKISSYSVTVRATDNGAFPLYSDTVVNINVSDVNDNPPMFFQFNYSVAIQENEPIGRSVLQLLVFDRDSASNGAPFLFTIAAGNEGNNFQIDHQGLLKTSARLRQQTRDHYVLQIQVMDSGWPPLSSSSFVRIQVIEESRHPPSVLSLKIYIVTSRGNFPGGFIGKIHATDRDLHDTLTYSAAPGFLEGGLFSVGSADGAILARSALGAGRYPFNVSVSDRRFTTTAAAEVLVARVTQDALDHCVLLEIRQLTPENFISQHWRGFQRYLSNLLAVDRSDVEMVSLQPVRGSSNLNVLLAVKESERAFYQPDLLQAKISGSADGLERTDDLRIERVSHRCSHHNCSARQCQARFQLDTADMFTYTTPTISFILPRHRHSQGCPCDGTAQRFTGRSYTKYQYLNEENPTDSTFRFRMQTRQSEALLMFTNGTDSSLLEVKVAAETTSLRHSLRTEGDKELCQSIQVNDGAWHSVLVEVKGRSAKLVVDTTHKSFATLHESCHINGAVFFGDRVQEGSDGLSQTRPRPQSAGGGYRGCLDRIEFHSDDVSAGEIPIVVRVVVDESVRVQPCCPNIGDCASATCQNGGSCIEISPGGYFCECAESFTGAHCELRPDACTSQPCVNGGTCIPQRTSDNCNCTKDPRLEGLLQSTPLVISSQEIIEIIMAVVGICVLVGIFVAFRKLSCKRKERLKAKDGNKLSKGQPESNGYCDAHIPLNILRDYDLDRESYDGREAQTGQDMSTFISTKQRERATVVCSVAPNLPPPPPSSSDNESIPKRLWEYEYEAYSGEAVTWPPESPRRVELGCYEVMEEELGRPVNNEVEVYDGFPFPLDHQQTPRSKRAPLPPHYSDQALAGFADEEPGALLPSHCQNEYTAISYYPAELLEAHLPGGPVPPGYRKVHVRLSVAQPSYAECGPRHSPPLVFPNCYADSDLMESDYGSCEEVMF
uniref:FAT atypical cadherin 2 n=1 Tax=Callorhinchus milii TaxID=7868 RepID=A0A4W3GD15_CALMI